MDLHGPEEAEILTSGRVCLVCSGPHGLDSKSPPVDCRIFVLSAVGFKRSRSLLESETQMEVLEGHFLTF